MRVFYVDPMSYHNLALYDRSLIGNLAPDIQVTLWGNDRYEFGDDRHVRRIYRYSGKPLPLKAAHYLLAHLRLLSAIRREQPGVLHMQWAKAPRLDLLLFALARRVCPGLRIVFTAHDGLGTDGEGWAQKGLRRVMGASDLVIVHTETTKRELTERGGIPPDRIRVIPHGLLDVEELPGGEKTFLSHEHSSRTVFGVLGAMNQYKGTDIAVEAWRSSEVLSGSGDALLIVAGKDEGKAPEGALPPNVLVERRSLSNGEFAALLRDVDVLVMPYRTISQSGLLLSAIGARTLLLVSRAGELTAPFRFGPVGWVLEKTDVPSLRSLLESILAEVRAKGLPTVDETVWEALEEHYSWRKAGELTTAAYRELLPPESRNATGPFGTGRRWK